MRFECVKCGKCCKPIKDKKSGYIYATYDEIIEIEERTNKKLEMIKYNDKAFKIIIDGECVFLQENGLCGIYDFAPLWCKTPPIIYNGFAQYYDGICTGIDCGKEWTTEEIENAKSQMIEKYGVLNSLL